jgi:DNA-binding transcriptional regulator YbjK
MADAAPRRRRYDPDRRERIAAAAIAVVARDGIDGLTHRAVAREADVPLGSTSYHFADKENLLRSAVELAEARNREVLVAILEEHEPAVDLAGALAGLVEELTVRQRVQLLLDYELYLAARRRPELRDVAERWGSALDEVIRLHADALTTATLAHLLEGVLIKAVVLDRPVTAGEADPLFRRVIAGP